MGESTKNWGYDTQNAKNGASNGSVKSVTSGISRISTTQQKIPKDHKFIVSTISSQHMAVFSHTAGTSAGPTSPLPPCPDKLSLEVYCYNLLQLKHLTELFYGHSLKYGIFHNIVLGQSSSAG